MPAQLTPGAGTEGLAPFGGLASGSGLAVAGTGMINGPSTITIDVPLGSSIEQVIAIWAGQTNSNAVGDDTILLDGRPVTGDLVGGPVRFFDAAGETFYTYTYRADVTGLNLVGTGTSNVLVSGFDFDALFAANKGCSLVVVYDNGTSSTLALREGSDNAFDGFSGDRQTTTAQVFNFAPSTSARTAQLELIVAAVLDNAESVVSLRVDNNAPTLLSSVIGSEDGPEWDTVSLSVDIPAGATSLTVELVSTDLPGENPLASITWVGAGFGLSNGGQPTCTRHLGAKFWLDNLDKWGPTGLKPTDKVVDVFRLSDSCFSSPSSSRRCNRRFSRRFAQDCNTTLAEALAQRGGRGRVGYNRAVVRAGIAALLNARHPNVRYRLYSSTVVRIVRYSLLYSNFCAARYYAYVLNYFNYFSEYCTR